MSVVKDRYNYISRCREQNPNDGEATPILYDKIKWTCIHEKTIWLSSTPDIPGSKSFNSFLPRIATLAIFLNNYTKVDMIFYMSRIC